MKKVIHGLYYNTDTAKKLAGYYPAPYDQNDFTHYSEELYKKRTGEYFLYGEGDAMSPYAKNIGSNEVTGGEEIKPLTFDEAKEWYEKAMNDDTEYAPEETYKKEFGQIVKSDEIVDLHIKISKGASQKLERLVQAQANTSKQDIIENLIWSAN